MAEEQLVGNEEDGVVHLIDDGLIDCATNLLLQPVAMKVVVLQQCRTAVLAILFLQHMRSCRRAFLSRGRGQPGYHLFLDPSKTRVKGEIWPSDDQYPVEGFDTPSECTLTVL